MTHVQILLFDGFDELDAIGPFEVLRRAALESDLVVQLVAAGETADVEAAYGLRVCADAQLDPSRLPDVLVVPGGGWNDRAERGAWAESERGVVPDFIAQVHRHGGLVTAVCTGTMLLAQAGLLDGRPAATHHSAREELRTHGAMVSEARVVDDGDVITAGGVTSGLDLALHLVERLAGAELACTIAAEMEYERAAPVHRERRR